MKKSHKILGFIAIAIAMFMGMLDATIINIALPVITKYFKATLNDTSWISTIYVLSLSVFMITASKIADQFGRRKVMIFGLLLFGGSSALCGLSSSLMFLIIMRCFQGIGGAIITPLVVPIALDAFGREKSGVIAGSIGAITALAAAGGPPVGGLLIEYVNWQSIFFINVPFAIIAIIFGVFFLRESYDDTASKNIDFLGILLLSAALFLLTFALLKGNDYGWSSFTIIFMFIGSIVATVLFIITELKVKAPMIELSLFRELTFTSSTICYLITGFGLVAPGLIFNYFLQNAMGYQPLHAALVVTPMALTVIISMPLGTIISNKLDARIVNFLGIFGMGVGAFMLSRLTVNTSESTMIGEMIIFGFAIGFAVQALVTSIKYLPDEKSGMGSGIVNAARYIGTCIGIALLVSMLTIHVTNAKEDIKRSATRDINSNKNIAASVKKVMVDDIKVSFKNSDNDNMQQTDMKVKMEKDIKDALSKLAFGSRPQNNEVLEKLYNGASSLKDGADKAADGQKKLAKGIDDLNTGMNTLNEGSVSLTSGLKSLDNGLEKVVSGVQNKGASSLSDGTSNAVVGQKKLAKGASDLNTGMNILQDGSVSLTSGIKSLDDGLAKALSGSQKLKVASAGGSTVLEAGISQLNTGAKKMLSQFSSSEDSNSPSIYDAVTGISGGAKDLSSNTSSYVNAVNNTLFTIIKNDPMSFQLLVGYKDSLVKAKAAYAGADATGKQQFMQQIQMLTNLISLYSVGTDTSVINVEQFQTKLNALAQQDEVSTTVVSRGAKFTAGAAQLADAAQRVSAQFSDGGSFKSGMVQLEGGSEKLIEGVGLNSLEDGMNKLSSSLSQLKNGSSKLYDGSQKLQAGIEKSQNGSSSLKKGSKELVEASVKINNGAVEFVNGMDKLSNSLSQLKNGSSKLYEGSQKLQAGIEKSQNGSNSLKKGSNELVDASVKIKDGAQELVNGIGFAGQGNDIQNIMDRLSANKDDKIAGAFDNTFLIAAIILMLASICGLFTDKSAKSQNVSSNKEGKYL